MLTGRRVGAYEILEPLASGGMGDVYRGRDTRLGRDAALKFLPGHLAANPEFLSRLKREARILAALNHPHIARGDRHRYGRDLESAISSTNPWT